MLSEFKEAEISKEENGIKVTIVFSPLVVEKYGLQLSKGMIPNLDFKSVQSCRVYLIFLLNHTVYQ